MPNQAYTILRVLQSAVGFPQKKSNSHTWTSSQPYDQPKAQSRQQSPDNNNKLLFNIISLLAVMFLFTLSLEMMSESFQLLGKGFATELVRMTANPFVGLFIGILATAVVQSSSTTTTLIVALVAGGELTLPAAIPMIMGANIGTAITSTIVSLGHIGNRREFKFAMAGATLHDLFNIFTAIFLFSIEISTGLFSRTAMELALLFSPGESTLIAGLGTFIQSITGIILGWLQYNPILILPIGLICLFLSLQLLTRILKSFVIGSVERNLRKYLFGHPLLSLLSGFVSTAALLSSSLTSSLMVPLIATQKISLQRAFPFLMGANIGTTTTAFIAALIIDSHLAGAALSVAFAHLLFNVLGTVLLLPVKKIREFPISLAQWIGKATYQNRLYGVVYVVAIFFLIPFLLIFLS